MTTDDALAKVAARISTTPKSGCKHRESDAELVDGLVLITCRGCDWKVFMNPHAFKAVRDALRPPGLAP